MLEGMWVDGDAMHRDLATIFPSDDHHQQLLALMPASTKTAHRTSSRSDLSECVVAAGTASSLARSRPVSSCCSPSLLLPRGGESYSRPQVSRCSGDLRQHLALPAPRGFVLDSCRRNPSPDDPSAAGPCVDVPVPGPYTCAQQAGWGKCSEPWMQGYCEQTCNTCPAARTSKPRLRTCSHPKKARPTHLVPLNALTLYCERRLRGCASSGTAGAIHLRTAARVGEMQRLVDGIRQLLRADVRKVLAKHTFAISITSAASSATASPSPAAAQAACEAAPEAASQAHSARYVTDCT
jgi:hypothetical protein